MNRSRLQEIERLVTPEDALQFALIKNNVQTIIEAIREHGIVETLDPEIALEVALEAIPENILIPMLKEHGYQPIPNRKQLLRESALGY
jgi:hypothetical protein